jgi:hypothetical protein
LVLGQVSIQLPLPVKLGKIRHRQRCRASPWQTAEQSSLQPLVIPVLA